MPKKSDVYARGEEPKRPSVLEAKPNDPMWRQCGDNVETMWRQCTGVQLANHVETMHRGSASEPRLQTASLTPMHAALNPMHAALNPRRERRWCYGPHLSPSLLIAIRLLHPSFKIQHPTSNIQHPISNIQHPTSNIQHPTSNRCSCSCSLRTAHVWACRTAHVFQNRTRVGWQNPLRPHPTTKDELSPAH
jgi:hypothetical protein